MYFRLVLPLVTRQTVNIMQSGASLNETTELSTYGFLVGTFPAAPGAFVVASQYNLDVELVNIFNILQNLHLIMKSMF